MDTDYPLAWKWRVFIPQGRRVRLVHRNHEIPKDDLPATNAVAPLAGPKELIVTLKLDKQPDGRWRSGLTYAGLTSYALFPDHATTWLTEGESGWQDKGVTKTVSMEQAGQPLLLLRRRVFYAAGGAMPPEIEPAQTDGLLVLLTE